MLRIKSQKRDPLVPPISISKLFDISCINHLDDIAVDQKELRITRRKLKEDQKTLAKAFLQLGIKRGDIITVATGRSMYDSILIFLAANKIGAVVSFLDEKVARDTLLHYLEQFKSPLLVTYRKGAKTIKDIKEEAKTVKHVMNLDGTSSIEGFMVERTAVPKVAAKYNGKIPNNDFRAKNPALISFTSGSTSGPKPMIFTNQALIASAIYSKTASKVKMWDKTYHSWMSYVHFDCPYGLVVSVLAPLLGGGEVILTPDICEDNLEYYFSKQPNTVFGIPPLLEMIQHTLPEDMDLSGIKMFASGGERLERAASEAAVEFLKAHNSNAKICNGYGVGEALGLISTGVGTTYRPDSVGIIPAGVHVAVLDAETDQELGFGKVGMICVSGKHLASGYFNRPELSEEKFVKIGRRRFLRTGDLAYVSETGYITLVGRATFFINKLPAKVYYEVVRAAVAKSSLVKQCYVVKQPDAKLGLSACAFVVVNEGVPKNNATRKQIVKDCMEPFYLGKHRVTLKSYELPQRVVIMEELPLTRADKIDFRKLEQMAKEDSNLK